MTICTDTPGTREYYKEMINVSLQRRKLLKNPSRKIINLPTRYIATIAVGVFFIALLSALGAPWGFDALFIIGITIWGISILCYTAALITVRKALRKAMAAFKPSVFTMDEQGVEVAQENTSTVRTFWENIAFIRVFSHGVCFAAKQPSGYMIFVPIEYASDITAYLAETHPEVQLITQ